MHIINHDSMPRFWWLVPWSYARMLKTALSAMKAYADQADRTIEMQIRIIDNYREEAEKLKEQVTALAQSREHWIKKHDRAYEVAMHNERVIADMEARGYVRL
jgi:hypothetical protein